MWQDVKIIGKVKNEQIELRYTPSGTAVANLNVSTYRKYKDTDGSSKYENTYFRVSVWGVQAETCQKYLHKDSVILVSGRLTPDKTTGGPRVFQKQDGSWGASYELFAETVRFLDGKSDNGSNGQHQPAAAQEEEVEPEL